ncbi:RtcB family protein [Methylocystis echinoides]|jgi:tRNA-splicing ligase RtcB|uniref:3'-phosphate/5'-hydroxy nucleic acid ligase n=1 Tax=Methylocystis echinoides TaxID=29468 RepID=A0A9W6LRL6_9HYPH|nr:RtcB family protein [Methylocystis echinoides]GLI92424.1 RNA-splicing ligase RtcB [Methylocystis echinoides]
MAYKVLPPEGGRAPIKMWCDGVSVEDDAVEQLKRVAEMPFIYNHLAVMPDVHLGKGATIGSVVPTVGAVIPAAVGVDLGCGMFAWRLSIRTSDLPDNLHAMRSDIEAAVPHGRTDNGGANDRGAWGEITPTNAARWQALAERYAKIIDKHPKARAQNSVNHLGTLGTGNHFIEVCKDTEDHVWVMLHSGSRGAGNKIGTYFIEKAKEDMRRYFINLPDADLAYIPEGTSLFDDYVEAVHWAQDFAWANRESMMVNTLAAIQKHVPKFEISEEAVNCHHNYIAKEHHFGKNIWVTRKGAVRARKGDLGIIPGSMGTGSYIVEGLGNEQSFCSCSHGAGRRMSRTRAMKEISLDDHIKATEGVECRKDAGVLDESPAAYKDISAVIAAQSDLVRVKYHLTQLLNVKG